MHATVEKGLGFEPEDGEDDCTCVDASEGVAGREDIDISDHICLVTVITAEGDESAHAQAVRVEDLECFIQIIGVITKAFYDFCSFSSQPRDGYYDCFGVVNL